MSNVYIVRARSEDGLTLTELLAAIVILGVCVVFLLGGTTFLPVAASTHRQDAQADAVLRNWAEAIKAKGLVAGTICVPDASNPYSIGSLQSGSFLPSGLDLAGFEAGSPVVKTWDGTATPAFQGCDDSGGARFARVGLTLTSAQTVHRVSESLEVVVANP